MVRLAAVFMKPWRHFQKIDMAFENRVTIITGVNGSGKSTVLKVISLAGGYSHFFEKPMMQTGPHLKPLGKILFDDGKRIDLTPLDMDDNTWLHTNFEKMHSDTLLKSYSNLVLYIPATLADFSDGFRVWEHQKADELKNNINYFNEVNSVPRIYSINIHNNFGLPKPRPPFSFVVAESIKDMIEGKGIFSASDYQRFKSGLKDIFPKYFEFTDIYVEFGQTVIHTKNFKILLQSCAHGLQKIFEIYWRLFVYSMYVKNFTVLIDEIESHLHPEMQRHILDNFIRNFPGVNFIIATHSPLVITSVRDASVYALRFQKNGRVLSERFDAHDLAKNASDIFLDILGVETTYPSWITSVINDIITRNNLLGITEETIKILSSDLNREGLIKFLPTAISLLARK